MSQRHKARSMVAKSHPQMLTGMQPPPLSAAASAVGLPPAAAVPSTPQGAGAMGMDNGSQGATTSGLTTYCRGGRV